MKIDPGIFIAAHSEINPISDPGVHSEITVNMEHSACVKTARACLGLI